MTPRTTTADRLDHAAETILLVRGQLPRIVTNITDQLPTIGAAAYDTERGGAEAWCEAHQCSVDRCHRARRLCLGVSLARSSDPTGEAAAASARADLDALERIAAQLDAEATRLLRIAQRYDRAPGDVDEASKRQVDQLNEHHCAVHLRCGYLAEPRGTRPTRVKHKGREVLDAPLWLCRWCEDKIRAAAELGALGRLAIPGDHEVRHHARKVGLERSDRAVAPPGDHADAEAWAQRQHGNA